MHSQTLFLVLGTFPGFRYYAERMSLREAKRASTRAALEESAWLLATGRPWAEITIDDIATGAGVARRTFFNYFESKEEVLGTLGAMRPGEFLATVRARPVTEDPWESMRESMLGLLRVSPRESIERMRTMWREPALLEQNVAGRRALEENLIQEIRRRRPALSTTEALLIASVFLTATRVALQTWVDDGESGDPVAALTRTLASVQLRVGDPA